MRQVDCSEKCETQPDLISGSMREADLHISTVLHVHHAILAQPNAYALTAKPGRASDLAHLPRLMLLQTAVKSPGTQSGLSVCVRMHRLTDYHVYGAVCGAVACPADTEETRFVSDLL